MQRLSDFSAIYWIAGGMLVALTVFFLVYAFKPEPRPVRRPLPPPPASRPMGQRYVSGQQRLTMGNQRYDAERTMRIDPDATKPVARRPVSAPPRAVRR